MTFFAAKTIKRKLVAIIMLTSSVALLLSCAAIFSFELASFRELLARHTAVMAQIIGTHAQSALDMDDKSAAREALTAFKAERHVLAACLYDRTGAIIATYYRDPIPSAIPDRPGPEGYAYTSESLNLFHKIRLDGQTLGTLLIEIDLKVVEARVRTYLGIASCVALSVTLIAFLISLRLQKVISRPLLHLASTANQVFRQRDYSVRAVKTSEDEMGVVIDRFNEMLQGIQERDGALLRAQDELELRVHERTKALQLEVQQRSQAELALRASHQKFETLVNSIDGVVWEADPNTFQFTFVSQQAAALLGYPCEEWLKLGFWQSHLSPEDHERAADIRRAGLISIRSNKFEYRMRHGDGRMVWIREISSYVVENREPRALRGVLLDITDQKEAEEQLDALNKQLRESSRHAGMAEVATGVLHNVGNVLNSVNVSSTLICDQIRHSKSARLHDLVQLFERHSGDLGQFLSSDPRGKVIPTYLKSLASHLSAEQAEVLKELELLTKNIAHIKEIVAMQQSYAKVSGFVESIPLHTLMDDALQMNAASLNRQGITVVRQYEEAPALFLDKHKVLQILVNLIRNAKYAMDASERTDKQLTLSVRRHDGLVQAIVQDNGIGIAPEQLARIFSHGFTTKRDGHGFGLHSGAIAAKQMGGSLLGHSDGPGLGAVFTLELPVDVPRADDPQRKN